MAHEPTPGARVLLALAFAGLMASSGAAEEPVTRRSDSTSLTGLPHLLRALGLGGYAPGDTAPLFQALTLDGRGMTLSGLKGRVVLITFWATWCPPCKEELPVFDRLYREHESRGLTVIGINVREGAAMVHAYRRALGLTFPILLDSDGDIAREYGVVGLPTTFLISRDGSPIGRAVGPRAWNGGPARAILKVLLEQAPAN